jgi:hypothetical protein
MAGAIAYELVVFETFLTEHFTFKIQAFSQN